MTWRDTSVREVGFSIERAASAAGVFVAVGSAGKNATTYRDSGLSSATTYYYRVRATGRRRRVSAYSNLASATTLVDETGDTAAPSTPASLTATPVSCGEVALAWEAATDTGGSGLAHYNVFRDGMLTETVIAPATSDSDSGVAASTAYSYEVSAVDTAGNESARRAAPTATTPGCANQPPVANAGPDQISQTLTTLAFDGTGSVDPDGTIASYTWSFGDGSFASGALGAHAYARPGTYTATLSVADNDGTTTSDTATVIVANRPPVANGGPDQTATAGQTVSLSGSASYDPDGTVTSYSWSFSDGTSATGASITRSFAAAGSYTATLTVTDDAGASGSDTALVTIVSGGGSDAWPQRFGSVADDRVHSVAVDGAGNVAVTGYFQGTVDFGGGPMTSAHLPHLDPNQFKDVFVAKYSPTGSHLWSRRFGADYDDRGNAIAVDGTGNVVVAGSVSNYVDFGDGTVTGTGGGLDVFVAKYAGADGRHLWSRRAGEAGIDGAYAVAVDPSGDVVVVGHFQGTVDFGGGPLSSTGGAGDQDLFVAKYSGADGQHLWSRRFGEAAASDYGYGVAADGGGNVLVIGAFYATVDFGKGPLTSAGGYDGFVAKYTSGGTPLWSKRFGGPNDDWPFGIAVDGSSRVVVTGSFQGTAAFGGGPLTSAGGEDLFLAKYAGTDGTHLWSQRFGNTGADRGQSVAVDGSGNSVVTGYFQTSVDLGGGTLSSAGGYDVFVTKRSPVGAHLWSERFGGTGFDYGQDVAVNGDGTLVATGYFQMAADFGGEPLTSAGSFDAFLVKLEP